MIMYNPEVRVSREMSPRPRYMIEGDRHSMRMTG